MSPTFPGRRMSRRRTTSPEMEAAFPLGSRVKYSAQGLVVMTPRDPGRTGTVMGYSNGGPRPGTICCVKVLWPDTKHPVVLHRDFLEGAV